MITVSKSELKAKMLKYFRMVEQTGEDIIVTDSRIPVIKVSPLRKKISPREIFKDSRVIYYEDILKDTSGEWEDK
jgi:antitoxin (DNA-binding transcriptional repressor) of toxin-antitoxin stability system